MHNVKFGEKRRSKTFDIGAQSREKLKALILDGKGGVETSGQDPTQLILPPRKVKDLKIFFDQKDSGKLMQMQFKLGTGSDSSKQENLAASAM